MRFLVDECTGKRLAGLLKNRGHDVLFVGDVMPSASDGEVIKWCEKDDRILITDDKDFGELIFRLGHPVKGAILLRIAPSPERRIEALVRLIDTYGIKNRFTVLEEGAVRSRKIV